MKREGLLSATGVLLLGIIALLTLHEWEDRVPGLSRQQIEAPALIIEGMRAEAFTASGALQYRLSAGEVIQFDHDNSMRITTPQLELRSPELTWEIHAEQGAMVDDGRLVTLSQGVNARYLAGDQPLTIQTGELQYRPRDEQLSVPGSVEIVHTGGHTRAGALDADLRTGLIQLRNRVESHYDVSQRTVE